MKCKETKHLEHEMSSAVEAQNFVRRMVAKETKGWGDTLPALERIENKYGLPFWTLNHIRIGRAKTVEGGMLRRIKAAYYDMCERQILNLKHELELDGRRGDDDNSDLLDQISVLAEEIKTKKQALKQRIPSS